MKKPQPYTVREIFENFTRQSLRELAITNPESSLSIVNQVLKDIMRNFDIANLNARIEELKMLDDEYQTYAQWVIEREEPKNLDKPVVRSAHIESRIKRLQSLVNRRSVGR